MEGNVLSIGEEGIVVEGKAEPLPSDSVLRIENAASTGKKSGESAALFLVGGGKVPVQKVVFDPEDESFVVDVEGAGEQRLSIDVVGAVLFDPKADSTRFHDVRSEPTTEFDRVLIDVGAEIQIIRGFLENFDEKSVSVDLDGEVRAFPREKVTGIVLASVPPDEPESWVEVVGANGSVFTGKSVTLDDTGSLSVHLGAGDPLKLPWTGVARVEFFSPSVQFLSDSRPKSSSVAPIVALPRQPKLGTNVLGGEIMLDGRLFRRGVGMPAGAEMMFDVKGFDWFRATVGIDDAAAGRGDCEVVVLVGGQEAFKARIKGGEPPKEVNVEIGGESEIVLKVIPGVDLDLADYVDWGDAVMIQKK